ncbi:MAG: tetratricopeptide repeat protein [Ignavibacteriae bacterium]|nr:tetratricopeptide repeat protein [Ignavibacteriota bacterium]
MNRTYRLALAVTALGVVLLATTGFQCSSPNVTSGKMYYQQYQSSKDSTKLNLAIDAFQKEVNEKPNSAEGWYWLGFSHGLKKDYGRLQEAWEKAKNLGPQMQSEIANNSPYFWQQAYLDGTTKYKKAGMKKDKALYESASRSLRAATRLAPDTSAKYEAFIILAYSELSAGNEAAALAALEEQNKFKPHAEAHRLIGQIQTTRAAQLKKDGKTDEATKKLDEAIAFLNGAVAKFPDNPDLNQELLNAYVAANRIVEAKEKFKAYADANPKDKNAQYAYGTVLLETKDYKEALTYLEKAYALDPKFENAMYNYCVASLRYALQVRDAESAANPEKQPVGHKPILEKALPLLKTLLTINADALPNLELAGKIYTSLGMTNEAQDVYKKADAIRGK